MLLTKYCYIFESWLSKLLDFSFIHDCFAKHKMIAFHEISLLTDADRIKVKGLGAFYT